MRVLSEESEVKSLVPEIKGEGLTVSVARVFPNVWNPNRMPEDTYKKTLNSLQKFDLSSPLIVRAIPEGYELIDGEHRFRAAQELGMTEVSVWNLGEVSDSVAKQLTIMFNELKGRPDIDSLSNLIYELDQALGREEIVINLPYSEQQISDLLATREFSWDTFNVEEEDTVSSGGKDTVRLNFVCPSQQADNIMNGIFFLLREYELEFSDENKSDMLEEIIVECLKHHDKYKNATTPRPEFVRP